jgi:hypothetical protein
MSSPELLRSGARTMTVILTRRETGRCYQVDFVLSLYADGKFLWFEKQEYDCDRITRWPVPLSAIAELQLSKP